MVDAEYAEVFREEAAELLEELETSLLALEQAPEELKLVGRVFRAMHTIKGSSAMFGFDDIAGFTHHVETVLDKVRDGTVPVTNQLIDLTLASRDYIKALLEAAVGGGEAVDASRGEGIIESLKVLVSASEGAEPGDGGEVATTPAPAAAGDRQATAGPAVSASLSHYRIRFTPGPEFYDAGGDPAQLIEELGKLGKCSVYDHCHDAVTGEPCDQTWDILLTTDAGIDAVKDVFIFVENVSEVKVWRLAEDVQKEGYGEHKRLGEILIERGDVTAADVEQVLSQQKLLGEMLVDAKLVKRSQVESALQEQRIVNQKATVKAAGSIRVASEKLDKLINLVGELVVTQARLSQINSSHDFAELLEPVEEVERLTAELRDCALNIRMLPIGTTFGKFSRLVRDLSADLGKEIDMVTEGADTELDKTVIEKLGDPLVHLIRNAIDHGIESPEERQRTGKPRRGQIRMAAAHSGANVVISVTDDGKGLDCEVIKAKAVARGIFKAGAELSDTEIFNAIFAPGFSTADKVTSVSGRGVGMDVVKSAIDELKGTVEVNSRKGEGTTVNITLPLTLAIIDGLLVRAGTTHFVLPLAQVEECVELTQDDIARFHGRRVLPVREQLVPYVRLREFFEITGERPQLEQMVVVHTKGERVGLVLDDVIGGHQTVIKSLGWIYRNAPGLSGSTILGSGEVALIIDVMRMVQYARSEELAFVEAGGRRGPGPTVH